MKSTRVSFALVLLLLLLFGIGGTALAYVENWVTDSTTGSKICIWVVDDSIKIISASWSGPTVDGKAEGKGTLKYVYKNKDGKETYAEADAEMKAGKLNGAVNIKWSDGDMYDGNYKDGLREGRGVFKSANGKVYDGDWKVGKPDGYGVGKDAAGKVIHDGQWKNGEPVVAVQLKADKILGIPWGASEDESKRIMLQRPKTSYFNSSKTATDKWQIYVGPYNDETAKIDIGFYQEKMYQVGVHLYANEDKIMDLFNYLKSGLTERYGAPMEERGKFLDSKVFWDLGGGYQAGLVVGKNEIPQLPASWGPSQLPWRFPFEVSVYYGHPSTSEKTKKPAGKDF